MKKTPLPYSNDENKALGIWLLTRVDGMKIMSQAKNAPELEKLVMEYAKKKGSVAGMQYDENVGEDEGEGLSWVTFGDLFEEVKSRM